MLSRTAVCARLSLSVERWLDAELILATEGTALLGEIAAARRALEIGEWAIGRRHTRQFLRAVEALVRSGLLAEEHGRPALAAARRLLEDAAG